MSLSEWPENFQDKPEPRCEIVEVVFDDEMLVLATTKESIGLTDTDDYGGEIPLWIPIIQIDGTVPERGEWIDIIRIPKWLADEKGLPHTVSQ